MDISISNRSLKSVDRHVVAILSGNPPTGCRETAGSPPGATQRYGSEGPLRHDVSGSDQHRAPLAVESPRARPTQPGADRTDRLQRRQQQRLDHGADPAPRRLGAVGGLAVDGQRADREQRRRARRADLCGRRFRPRANRVVDRRAVRSTDRSMDDRDRAPGLGEPRWHGSCRGTPVRHRRLFRHHLQPHQPGADLRSRCGRVVSRRPDGGQPGSAGDRSRERQDPRDRWR
jgi:hypothetical protein